MSARNLSPNERAILVAFEGSRPSAILSFDQLSKKTGLDRSQVRNACQSLRSAGMTSYQTGGAVGGGYNGAGYMITASGKEVVGQGNT